MGSAKFNHRIKRLGAYVQDSEILGLTIQVLTLILSSTPENARKIIMKME